MVSELVCDLNLKGDMPIALMAGNTTSSEIASDSTSPNTPVTSTPLNPDPSFHSTITAFKLNGRNFIPWSRSMQMLIRGKGKFGLIDGSIPQPEKTDPSYPAWEIQNSLVMTWLIQSMESQVAEIYLLYPTAKAIWEGIMRSFSDLEDSSQMFFLRTRARNLRQETSSVTTYFHSLTRLWQELDLFQNQQWHDVKDVEIYRLLLVKERTYDFLAGLNPSLDEVRGRILGIKPLPSLDEIFSEVRREEHRKVVMLGSTSVPSIESSAMVVRGNEDKNKKSPATWCEFCHKPYHTKAKCWKLHGKPADWVPKHLREPGSSGHTASSSKSDDAAFTKTQLDQISKLLSSSTGTSLMAQSGNHSHFVSTIPYKPWVIDSGASDHMTGCKSVFSSIESCNINRTVQIANGSVLKVCGTGSVPLGPNLSLRNVLYVPGFSFNLLSISKLTSDLSCNAMFSPSLCQFQDLRTGKVIGSAKEVSGLYYFFQDAPSANKFQAATACLSNSLSRSQQIKLLHCRLGHPSFMYLKRLFPTLFTNNDKFDCEVCQLAKHKRIPFPFRPYQPSKPFFFFGS